MLDNLDKAIMQRLQINNQKTYAELGEEVGLSISAVRKRIKRLRDTGVIEADVSVLSPQAAGIQVIISVVFEKESVEGDEAFRERMLSCPEVVQCYAVSGDVDYFLIVQMPDIQSYEAWGKRYLMSDRSIRRYQTHIVWNRVKFSLALPLPISE